MTFPTRSRATAVGVLLLSVGLVMGAALASWASAPAEVAIRESATLVSVLPQSVMSLTYTTPNGMTTAQRSAPGRPFHILSTFADNRPAQHCTSASDMEKRLDSLATLTARRSLSFAQRESEFPIQLGVIEVRSGMLAEPSNPVLVFANKDRAAVAVILDGRAAEVTLRVAELVWLEAVCTSHA